jgi:hypothetical protein
VTKPKLFFEKTGFGLIEGIGVTGFGLGLGPGVGLRSSSSLGSSSSSEKPEDAEGPHVRLVDLLSTLSSSAIEGLAVRQIGSSQVRFVFTGGYVSNSAFATDTVMVFALEVVAQLSQVVENPVVSRFVFPSLSTSSSDLTFSVAVLFVLSSEVLSLASLEASLRYEGSSLSLVSTVLGFVEHQIQPTSFT